MKQKLIIMCILIAGTSVYAKKQAKYATIDWKKGAITAYGSSKINIVNGRPFDAITNTPLSLNMARIRAYQYAKGKAIQAIINELKKIRVDADNSFMDLLLQNEDMQIEIMEKITRHTKITNYPMDFNVSGCKAELKIGNLIELIPYKYSSLDFPERADSTIKTVYTSVIIDTRGLSIKPMLFPVIYNFNGLDIYSRHHVDIRYSRNNGIVTYEYTELEAMKNKLAGQHPFFTVAIKKLNGSPVIADRDMKKIFSSEETTAQLKKCKVIFIIDRK